MTLPNEISELPAVIEGLEGRIDASLRRWMKHVKPLPRWETSESGSRYDGPQPWWPAFCGLAEGAFRDGVNHLSAVRLKSQILAATKSTEMTQTLMSKICRLSTEGFADAFADPPAQSLAPGNLVRAYLAERGIAIVEPRFEELRDAGVGYVMRMIRYSFLPHDDWYSAYLKDPALAAKASGDQSNKSMSLGPRKYAHPDWKRTSSPHRAIPHAIRYLILNGIDLSPGAKIPLTVARTVLRAVRDVSDSKASVGKVPWGESPEHLIQILKELWITPFVLTVFALDPLGLAEATKAYEDARRKSNAT